jgi:DNA-binding SARP family transcriptional activator
VAPRSGPVEVAVLGNVQVNGAPESFRYRRRLTELVAFLAMHPEGATTDAFATALWPERRVPLQTLANRLSETRRALGLASDGRPRLRKHGGRHLIVEVETDWDRFRDLASETGGADSWRRALALVRGRPFDGLDRGEWAQLEGHMAAVEASVVGVACRLGEHALERGDGGLAHWAALQGLLVSPWDERLYRLLMRAADGLGNRGGVDAALRSLALALELEGDPLLGIHPETSALYRNLTARSLT